MFEIKNNEKINKAMSLRGRAVGSDVVIFHAKTEKALSLLSRCCTSEKQKESSLILRKAKFQAIFKFVLSSASGGAGGGKYNIISAFVSMPVLLIRRSLEKFFKKNFRDDRFCFGFAKVLALALIFTLATTAESRAECSRPTNGVCKTLGESGTCGKGCSYTYDSVTKTVNITATGEDAEIAHLAFHRLYYEGNSMPVQTYIINGAVKVGESVISSTTSRVIFGGDGVLTLNGIGQNAFGESTLSGTIVIPEGATFAQLFFYDVKLADKAKIYCGVENCAQKMIDACNAYPDDKAASKCLNSVNKIVSDGKLLAYPENCLKMGVNGCTKCKSDNFKLNDGYCDRIRYTPAEAAEVLRDDDKNEITITFKQ